MTPSDEPSVLPSDQPTITPLGYYNITLSVSSDCGDPFTVDGFDNALAGYHTIVSENFTQGLTEIIIFDLSVIFGDCEDIRRNMVSNIKYTMRGRCTGLCPDEGLPTIDTIRRKLIEQLEDLIPGMQSLIKEVK